MLVQVFAVLAVLTVGAYGQFPFNMMGFDPTMFASQMQNMFSGLQNMGANMQAMSQRMMAENVRRARESGTFINTNDLRPGEFRRYTGPDGSSNGFAFRSADGQSGGFSFSSGGTGSGNGYFFTSGPGGNRFYRF